MPRGLSLTCMGRAKLCLREPLVSERSLCSVKNAPDNKQWCILHLHSRVHIATLVFSKAEYPEEYDALLNWLRLAKLVLPWSCSPVVDEIIKTELTQVNPLVKLVLPSSCSPVVDVSYSTEKLYFFTFTFKERRMWNQVFAICWTSWGEQAVVQRLIEQKLLLSIVM